MSTLQPRLTVVTIGVRDVRASTAFYEALGFVRKMRGSGDEISFIEAGGVAIALWSWEKLAADACVAMRPEPQTFRGTTLAWNCKTPAEVDAAFAKAMSVGAKSMRQPGPTEYGGYRGYFADPDDHVWEVVTAPGMGFTEDGRLILPD